MRQEEERAFLKGGRRGALRGFDKLKARRVKHWLDMHV